MTLEIDSHDPLGSGADSWVRADDRDDEVIEEDVGEEQSGDSDSDDVCSGSGGDESGGGRVPDGWTVDVDGVFDTPADGCRAVLEGAPNDADFDAVVDVVERCVRGAGESMVRRHALRARYDESYDVDSDVRVYPLEKYM